MFWAFAVAIALLSAIAICWPILRAGGKFRNYGLALVVFIPLAALFMYQKVGTPGGIDINGTPDRDSTTTAQSEPAADEIAELTSQLEQRLVQDPDDLQGWLLLGRTYKTTLQYGPAETALARAFEIAPENPLVMVELAEARMFNSGSPVIGPDIKKLLEKALTLDPKQQKGLWLLGFASSQSGNDARAVELWENLLAQMDPSFGARTAVQDQISQAMSRMGLAPAELPLETVGWQGINIEVSASNPDFNVPAGAVLFVIARNPQAPGPPVGVRRIFNPVFPVNIRMSDADSMLAASPVSGADPLQLLARLSLSGSASASPGDPESEHLMVILDTKETVQLELLVPVL